ncbi:Wzz/FepE/Etk N-terminal domain-containing protein [Brachybacterium sp. p3-SID1565]|uniref:YveK family protein n=1 Tax=Brachybacterium sp. p3-SID1565 TaxID=2916046 RepID=UPI0021A94913|nr:Wzz/FepE/Etk N-terminal domain-containing protein [Brachybacterium sp. p3-SID1565]MCT1385833.1 Wzz/FepE/Etk N-terminal domain-containing protein [Brachybacterium sp. p3-SID1565]
MTTERMLTSLRRRWPLVVLCTALGAVVALAALVLLPPTYEARTQVLVEVADPTGTSRTENVSYVQQSMPTLLQLAHSSTIAEDIAARTGGTTTPAELRDRLTYTVPEDTTVIEIVATSSSPQDATMLAQTAARTMVETVPAQAGAMAGLSADILQPAAAATSPVWPDPKAFLPAGLIGGLLVGVLAALLASLRDRHARDLDEIEEAADGPVVGVLSPMVPSRLAGPVHSRAVATTMPRIFSALGLGDHRSARQVLAVSAAHCGVDAGYVAAGLVRTAQASGVRAALVLNDTTLTRARASSLVAGGLEDLTVTGPRRLPGAILTSAMLRETMARVPDGTELVVVLCGVVDEDPDVRAALEHAARVLLVADLAPPIDRLRAAVHCATAAHAHIDGVVLCDTQTPDQAEVPLPSATRERSTL